jgi:peptidoglycan/LPS O-acetylase OafA/YrhL
MPPYYTALAGVVLLPLVVAPCAQRLGLVTTVPALPAWNQVWTHVALVHTLFADTYYGLNGPFWSLGIEVQFYLAFPLAVWLVDRFDWRAVGLIVLATFGYRIACAYAGNAAYQPLDLADVFLGRWLGFALGMLVAARVRCSLEQRVDIRVEVSDLLGAIAAFLVASYFLYGPMRQWQYPPKDLLFAGFYSVVLYLACTQGSLVGRLFACRVPVWLGKVSYSLYLIHLPIIVALAPTILALKLAPATTFGVMTLILVPLVLALTAAFQHVFERPFVNPAPARQPRSNPSPALEQPLARRTEA